MAKNLGLSNARNAKKDEFYTQLKDINAELVNYEHHFKGKTILMNCDDPTWSNFWRYFHMDFERLELKKIIATHYEYDDVSTYKMEYEGGDDENFEAGVKTDLTQNGDFRSPECIELLKEADIVITNPPFSLFREYVTQLMSFKKKFLIIGNINCITYKEIFPLIKNNEIWLGTGMGRWISGFIVPEDYPLYGTEAKINENGERIVATNNCLWLTNLDHRKRHEFVATAYCYRKKDQLYPMLYPQYDNYEAINVNKVIEIPMYYSGEMGVPITFLDKYNPEQFEIIGISGDLAKPFYDENGKKRSGRFYVNGKRMYDRIVIKRKE